MWKNGFRLLISAMEMEIFQLPNLKLTPFYRIFNFL
jgi:hypothetical protein